jgi:cell wall-associated NlpC family hydrolase
VGAGWGRLAVAGGLRLAVLGLIGALGCAVPLVSGPRPVARSRPLTSPSSVGRSAPSLLSPPAAARAGAKADALSAALSGLRTQAEALAERYDHEVSLERQASAAYQAADARLAAARKSERRAAARLAQLAAAEYESDGGPSMAAAVFAGITDPRGYLGAIGLRQAMDKEQTDLLAAAQADAIVTRLFSVQAAGLLAQRRTAAQAAGFLRAALVAAVSRQAGLVRLAETSRSRLAAETASERASEATLGSAPDWAPDAGASAAQGDAAADWALTQLGQPYQWGAAGPGSYDCSGLAMEAWARAGVRLLHWTGYQWVSGPHVPLARLRRGDLVFYAYNVADPATIHHVGIYLGRGLMADAPYTGSFVRIDSIHAFPGLIGAIRPAA